ncbi:MAG: hypothetical protein HXY40_09605 [Chloroflexi bacterium]|nr:hypothetical protein [Chloroflexota bacterium]
MTIAAHENLPAREILDFLLSQPTPQQIIDLRPSEALQERLRLLLDGNRNNTLNDGERIELEEYLRLEHFVRQLKIR